ncbi:ion transporter [Leptospira sp. 96542]|nr:ion transporter [Leptospira sp. 96542]
MDNPHSNPIRKRIYEIIFEADTRAGRLFDIILISAILLSTFLAALETEPALTSTQKIWLYRTEWFFVILFTAEYFLRLYSVKKPLVYAFSFFGLVDFFAIFPAYLELVGENYHLLTMIRIVRVIRVFRILKLARYLDETNVLISALKDSRRKVTVFLTAVLILVTVIGTLMYFIESPESGFTSIPVSVYWAIVTLTTVGFGDIAPQSPLGRTFASLLMLTGYGILAVPTGIFSSALLKQSSMSFQKQNQISTQTCPDCLKEGHDSDAVFCKYCAAELNP